MEDLGGDVLGLAAIAHTADHERVNTFEVAFVKLSETARIELRRRDELPFVLGFLFGSLQRFSRQGVPRP
jgi:hypothetical protein